MGWGKIRVEPSFYVVAALLLLVVPLKLLFAMIAAASFHELCHCFVLRCFGVQMYGLQLGIHGANLKTESMGHLCEFLCAIAGPLGGFLLLLLGKWMPLLALCGGFQSLFNLLPIYPLDGGRMLRCLLQSVLPIEYAIVSEKAIISIVVIAAVVLGIYGTFCLQLGLIPMGLVCILMQYIKKNKNSLQSGPCGSTIQVTKK